MKTLSLKIMLVLAIVSLASSAYAELKLNSVYPNVGEMGKDLTVTLTGKGFDQNTRVSMALDTTNKRKIVGSVDMQGYKVNVIGNIAYVLNFNNSLQIIDISNPTAPSIIGSVDTPDKARNIAITGNIAYVANYLSGLQIIDVSNPTNPVIIGSIDTPSYASGVKVVGNIAYVADYASGLQIIDVSNPSKPVIIGTIDTPGGSLDIAVNGNTAYVADSSSGIQVIDVSNPLKPVIIGSLNLSVNIKTVTVIGNTVYATTDKYLVLIDVSNSLNPTMISFISTSNFTGSLTVINNVAYIANGYNGLHLIDISHPSSPVFMESIDTNGYANDVTVIGSMAYVANSHKGLQILDISDLKANYFAIDTPGGAYNVSVIGSIAYIADTWSGLQVIDVNNPAKAVIIGSVDTPGSANDVTIIGNIAYVADQERGLQVLDVSNPIKPSIIGSVDTPGFAFSIAVRGNIAYIADFESGLQIIDVSNPSKPFITGSIDTPGSANDVTVIENTAYVADRESGLQIIDVSNPSKPSIIGSVDTPGSAYAVAVIKGIAYVADSGSGLQVIDVSNPSKPTIIGSVDTPSYAIELTVIGNTAYIADSSSGLQMIDISNPAKPFIIGSVDTPGFAYGLAVNGNMAYIADNANGLSIIPLPVKIRYVTVNSPESITLTLPSPQIPGNYTLRVFNDSESHELTGAVSYMDSPDFQKLQGKKAIIVAGGGPYLTNTLWHATQTCTADAYIALQAQGYTRENIYYLSSDPNIDVDGDGYFNDVDADATSEYLSYAINVWAKDASELILFMVDHGGYRTFQINGTKNPPQILRADELDRWLDNLQTTMPGRLTVIYDACQSGSFLSMLTPLAGKERIVIASSSEDQRAWHQVDGVLSFSYQFWSYVNLSANLYDSFVVAKNVMKDQTPMIDANGNGIANEKEDLRMVTDIIIGRGRVAASAPPFIGTVSGNQVLDGGRDASFEAKNISSLNKIKRVWAVIIPPDYNLASANQPVSELPVAEMTDEDNDGVYRGHYSNFTQTGTYRLSIYAADDQNSYSVPQQTTVTQTHGNTCISVSGNLVLNLCVEYQGVKYACTLNPQNVSELTWNLDISTLRPIQSDNCIGIGDNLKLDMCAEYLGHTYGFTMNYDRELIWKMDIGTFKPIN